MVEKAFGVVKRVSGPLVVAKFDEISMYEVVYVGEEGLIGEVIRIDGNLGYIQVYEDTTGIKPGDKVERTFKPLSAMLGPGLIRSIYDGLQRPLEVLREKSKIFLKRGLRESPLDLKKEWEFVPLVHKGKEVGPGSIIGEVEESFFVKHKILVPPNVKGGKIKEIYEGKFRVTDTVAILEDGTEIKLHHFWPVRIPRPYKKKLPMDVPFVTGIRVFDIMFPISKGGSAAVPGPFGSGKTVVTQSLAKWSEADIVVLIGCGERGNEMTDVLEEFPQLEDPKSGKKLIERTIVIANTSNMPVAARESSVYMGITIAEYYRDQGYNVLLVADSTSRWAEAMREISGRLGEMPGEEGYPSYLARRLAEFYERGGRVITNSGKEASVTIVASVSPPGGDFSEPVTQNTLRIVSALWALSKKLAARKHFPAIDYLLSYTKHFEYLEEWYKDNLGENIINAREEFFKLLRREAELQEFVQVVGMEALPEEDQAIIHIAKVIKEGFLQQDAFHENDSYSSLEKTTKLVEVIMAYYRYLISKISEGKKLKDVISEGIWSEIVKLRFLAGDEFEKKVNQILSKIQK